MTMIGLFTRGASALGAPAAGASTVAAAGFGAAMQGALSALAPGSVLDNQSEQQPSPAEAAEQPAALFLTAPVMANGAAAADTAREGADLVAALPEAAPDVVAGVTRDPLPAVTPDWLPGAARNTPTAPTPDTLPVSPSSVGTATQLSTVAITDATTGVESVASRVVAPVGGTAASVQPVKASPLAPSASSVPIAPAGGAPSGEESVISAEATTKPTPVTSAARLDGQRSPATGAAAAREDTPVLTRVPTATRAASTVPAATAGTNAHGAHSSPQSKDAGMAVAATAHPAPASAVAEVASAAAATVVPPASAPVAPVTAPPVSAPAPIAAAQSAPFSQQLGQPIFTLAAAGNGDHVMTVTVTPDNLGPVTVRAHVSADGLRVELFAPNDFGREAIRAILPELRRDLAGGGLSAHLDLSSDSRPADPRDGDAGRDRRAPAPTPVLAERQTEEGRQHARMQGTSSTIDVMA